MESYAGHFQYNIMKLVFATNNNNKLKEVRRILPPSITLLSLKDIGCTDELPETHSNIEENSWEKAIYVYEKYGENCFAEDSGLEVEALNGEPGVDSAHYSGNRNADNNIQLLLHNLKGITNRNARFKTVFTLVMDGDKFQFTGIVTGKIADTPRGSAGFGYDPVFIPDGSDKTFAEIDPVEKVLISHRSKAFNLLTGHLFK